MIHVVTVGHTRFDTRIWYKEISSLLKAGYSVKYHVADGSGNEVKDSVDIIDYGAVPEGCGFLFRLKKMYQVMRQSKLKRGDWIHFHDGIFLPFAIMMSLRGCKVIYDVHEDYPRQVLNTRFPLLVKALWAKTLSFLEWLSSFFFVAYFVATPKIAERFPRHKTWVIHNFPLKDELSLPQDTDANELIDNIEYFFYVGVLSEVRGVKEMIDAIYEASTQHPQLNLALGGNYSPESLRTKLETKPGWGSTTELGWMTRNEIASWLKKSKAGLVTLHPTKNYPDAYPVKLFEYMSAGLPVIASDFPLWREIVEEAQCGLLVNPLDPLEISKAMVWLIENPESAKRMGDSGRKAVENRYNWSKEENTLISAYKTLGVV